MARKLDYDALRAQTLGSGSDEAVTVNTRALIDKVLARYSGEWTTLRELLQNAADASANRVVIRFETLPSPTVPVPQTLESATRLRHVLVNHTLKSTVIENDGEVFKGTDWARLKKIAEGNPDETKIGAFGVGFYSVFADSEEPFVSSGKEALAFYWKGDALFTKRLQLPNAQSTKTTFMLPMRNTTSPVPNLLSLCQFLTSSLTFVGLEGIELWLDEWRILNLAKKTAPSVEIHIPKEVNRKTREGLMHVSGVSKEAAQLDAQWLRVVEWRPRRATVESSDGDTGQARGAAPAGQSLRSFFSRIAPSSSNSVATEKLAKEERDAQEEISKDLLGVSIATMFVHVNKATVRTFPNQNFSAELERATKKPPPKTTTVSLLCASYDETIASSSFASDTKIECPKVFDSFLPVNGKGRIFIGFTTNQTTGLNIHISTPSIIPTVERESIDLNNRFVRVWNVEILRVAGLIARISWGQQAAELREKLSRTIKLAGKEKISNADVKTVLPDALYLHNQYGWSETTPASEVGTLMEEAFWTCNQKVAIATLSTQGVLPASKVRTEPEEGLGFVEGIPVLPQAIMEVGLIKKLIGYGVITEITISDIKAELEAKALTTEQLRRFLGWLGHKARIGEVDAVMTRSLLDVAVANDEEDEHGGLLVLSECRTYLNTSRIPAEMPVPPTCLPFKFTKKMDRKELEILGFEDLQMMAWLRWLTENTGGRGQLSAEHDITQNPAFASIVLPVISKQWEGLAQSSKSGVVDLLSTRTVMPTKLGLRKPSESYFPNVQLFDDLPNVKGLNSVKDKFLTALGVRKTIDLGVIFARLFDTAPNGTVHRPKSSPKWSHADLIKYLASVRADIPPADIVRLRSTRICPAETESLQPTQELYLVSELFEPDQMLRKLRLRTLQWPGVYRPGSPEGRFLTYLGLRNAPSATDLIEIMAKSAKDQDWALREYALKYFIDQHQTKGYVNFDNSAVTTPYLPVEGSEKKLASPKDVFVNERSSILGFNILRRDLQIHALKFGVKQEPPVVDCVNGLINNPPTSARNARELFSYLASRTTELKQQQIAMLSEALIVPIPSRPTTSEKSVEPQRFSYHPPRMCFLGVGERYADIFDFVDFGQEANTFLLACGSKHEPSTTELARRLVSEPAGIFSILGDARYLELLRSIADSWKLLKKDKALAKDLKASKCLLAYKEISSAGIKNENDEEEEDSGVKLWQLASASQIVIVDDTITYNQFREALLAAPMEDTLEDFYHSLGSAEVATLMEEQHRLGPQTRDQSQAVKLQRLLLERTRLFLNDFPTDLVKHNYTWVQKNLTVECVQAISVKKTLRGYNIHRTGSRSAIVANHKPVLYITPGGADIFEVSQALVPVLLNRSKPQYVFMLEMMLDSSLQKLRSRGYNIDRILRSKAAEARIVEETRKKQVAEEQQRLKEQEDAWRERQAAAAAREAEQPQLPGVFPDSPSHSSHNENHLAPVEQADEHRPRGFFSGIRKVFDFDRPQRTLTQSPQNLPIRENGEIEASPPPPYPQEQPPQNRAIGPTQPEPVTAPHHLQQNLINAIQSSRGHNSNMMNSAPTVTDVKETATYCDAKPGHDIKSIGETSGVRIFVSNKLAAAADQFLAANGSALKLFAGIVLDCADAFSLNRSAVHIFYDDSGSTIAFNANKALFFNYRYFENLHLPDAQQGRRGDAVVYWSVVMAHELAFVSPKSVSLSLSFSLSLPPSPPLPPQPKKMFSIPISLAFMIRSSTGTPPFHLYF